MAKIHPGKMIVTTTSDIPGWKITHIFGIVTGEAIIGANIFRDLFASITDIVGGRSSTYEKGLWSAKELALDDLRNRAGGMGANAVISADLDYETINNMLIVAASGTAVWIEQDDQNTKQKSFDSTSN